MIKEEIRDKLRGTKVFAGSQTREIQEKLFRLGFRWSKDSTEVFPNAYFICIDGSDLLTFTNDAAIFIEHAFREISISDILDLEEYQEEVIFNPFDRVLVRDEDDERWELSVFAYKREKEVYPYICLNGHIFEKCIPYEGNEHLLGEK